MEDTNDPAVLLKECQDCFAECERTYIDILDYDYENPDGFEEELIRKIPLHVQKYMEISNIFAYDLDSNEFDNERATDHKIEQVLFEDR